MTDRAYVLGTHDEEIERLGLQHRVWRPRVTACWQRAGFSLGQSIMDVGAGPGYAAVDLAQIVGDKGRVVAFELSDRFAAYGRAQSDALSLKNLEYRILDLVNDELEVSQFDAAWCRWVMSFVENPAIVVRKVAACLKTGGRFVIHEYLDYSTFSFVPRTPTLDLFVSSTMENWRSANGEPSIGHALVSHIRDAGLKIVHAEPVMFLIRPGDYAWQWPRAWIDSSLPRLVESGQFSQKDADALIEEFRRAESDPSSMILSPSVIEIIAEKV